MFPESSVEGGMEAITRSCRGRVWADPWVNSLHDTVETSPSFRSQVVPYPVGGKISLEYAAPPGEKSRLPHRVSEKCCMFHACGDGELCTPRCRPLLRWAPEDLLFWWLVGALAPPDQKPATPAVSRRDPLHCCTMCCLWCEFSLSKHTSRR